MGDTIFRKHPLIRMSHYLFLLPFLPGLRPLLVNYRLQDLIIFIAGIVLIVVLVIYGNQRPFVIIGGEGLSVFHRHRHAAVHHPFKDISGYKRSSSSYLLLYSKDRKPVILHLKKNDVDTLVKSLEKENINAV